MAERRAGAGSFPALERGGDVIGPAGGNAKPADIDEQPFCRLPERLDAGPLCAFGQLLRDGCAQENSARSRRAASTMDLSLPKAESRGRNFIPQSGARITSCGSMNSSARLMRATTVSGDSTSGVERSMHPTRTFLPGSFASTEQSSFGSAVSMEISLHEQLANSERNEYPEGLFFR